MYVAEQQPFAGLATFLLSVKTMWQCAYKCKQQKTNKQNIGYTTFIYISQACYGLFGRVI